MTRRILVAAILIPLVFASILLFPLPAFLLILTALLFLALREFSLLASASGSTLYPISYVLALTAPYLVNYSPHLAAPFSLAAVLITFSWCLLSTNNVKNALPSVAGNILGLCYLAIPFSMIATFHPASPQSEGDPTRPYELILVLLLVWVSDAAALFTGRLIGKHRFTPFISPNKTLEGFLAALIFPVVTAIMIGGYFLPGASMPYLLSAGLIVALTGVLGDLFESILKRGAEIKDTSNLIPGHGGILDRIDSLLFAVPSYHLLTFLSA